MWLFQMKSEKVFSLMNRKRNECTMWHDLFSFLSSVWQSDCLHWKKFDLCLSQAIDSMSAALCHGKEKWKISIIFVCHSPGIDSAHWSDVFGLVPNSPLFQFLFFTFFRRKLILFSAIHEESKITIHIMSAPSPLFTNSLRHCINWKCCFANRFEFNVKRFN